MLSLGHYHGFLGHQARVIAFHSAEIVRFALFGVRIDRNSPTGVGSDRINPTISRIRVQKDARLLHFQPFRVRCVGCAVGQLLNLGSIQGKTRIQSVMERVVGLQVRRSNPLVATSVAPPLAIAFGDVLVKPLLEYRQAILVNRDVNRLLHSSRHLVQF